MNISHGGIGEVVNTPDCGSGMRGFDPHYCNNSNLINQLIKMHKDLIILNGPKASILAFVRAITLKGYHTCTRIDGPSTNDNIVALVDLVQKEE